ncbi:hypothetical protein CHLNCDRAFT_139129 [Chlorella variabilis]|uniref:Polysaccharide pyruvyl transferase domain-containing protein n=1 Tax=Chlorella variabilis TaxID=554065 RepID=E1ZPI3_CHLVA|nr:hypothetical protein CHLNCDRAFT_139129 [Chlorella variabilis]EFN52328.1 hypothetical protein CHLNCDRAFT_139129 [Chlorella variabilis]|eukprot:XP_005844430.1 hypothetical protein CHLNCDRAFT_139129 [Chlorella variabilis]
MVASRPHGGNTKSSRHLQLAVASVLSIVLLWTLMVKGRASADTLLSRSGGKVRVGWVGRKFNEGRLPSGLSLQEASKVVSDNFGNMMWSLGARNLVDHNATELVSLSAPPHRAAVHAVLMPTANLLTNLSMYKYFQDYTKVIATIARAQPPDTPILVIGIGTQVQFDDLRPSSTGTEAAGLDVSRASEVQLPPEQVSFLKRVLASGGIMTARGRLTAAVITANGLPPPLPLGCPSLFLNHNPRLGATLQQKWDAVLRQRDPNLRLAITMPAVPGELEDFFRPIVQMLSDRIFKVFPNSVAILQTKRDIDTLDWFHERHDLYLREGRVRYYYDPQSWFDSLKSSFDFVFGFRIHGTMAGVASEVPGLVIATDLRIRELADSMIIPTIDMDKANLKPESFDLFDFIESVPSYGNKFDARRREVAKVYAREFKRLGVPLNPGIASIARLEDSELAAEEE